MNAAVMDSKTQRIEIINEIFLQEIESAAQKGDGVGRA